jgi:hypothetical protein
MASYASGIIQFAQTRRIEAGVSLRLKLNPSTIASIQAEILTCGDNVMPDTDTGHPVLFHASFDNVRQKRSTSEKKKNVCGVLTPARSGCRRIGWHQAGRLELS